MSSGPRMEPFFHVSGKNGVVSTPFLTDVRNGAKIAIAILV